MKKSIVVILGILALSLLSGPCASAQADALDSLSFPGSHSLSLDNMDEFFGQLEKWSRDVEAKATPNRYNDVLVKFFEEMRNEALLHGKYVALPVVKVLEYDFDLNPASWTDCYLDEWPALDSIPVRISYYIPVVECEKKVLYLTPEVKGIILSFLNERIGQSRERYMMSAKYMPVFRWPDTPDGYTLSSWPLDDTVYVGKDGFVFLCESLGWGALYFVPWGKDPIEIRGWIVG